jgi:hypothetical protein
LPATSENAGRNAGAPQTHAFLARIYTDDIARRQFIQAPRETALNAGFAEADAEVMARIDVTGLELAARSFAKKRRARQ